jgi:16S rRNA (cytosine1402-N4)-methyltransferase
MLGKGGKVAVISFHSLEDRIVKNYFRKESTACICPPGLPVCCCGHEAQLKLLTRHAVSAEKEEVAANSRSACAKLRAAEKIG